MHVFLDSLCNYLHQRLKKFILNISSSSYCIIKNSYAHTHIHKHTLTHTHKYTHTLTHTLTHTHTHTHTQDFIEFINRREARARFKYKSSNALDDFWCVTTGIVS